MASLPLPLAEFFFSGREVISAETNANIVFALLIGRQQSSPPPNFEMNENAICLNLLFLCVLLFLAVFFSRAFAVPAREFSVSVVRFVVLALILLLAVPFSTSHHGFPVVNRNPPSAACDQRCE